MQRASGAARARTSGSCERRRGDAASATCQPLKQPERLAPEAQVAHGLPAHGPAESLARVLEPLQGSAATRGRFTAGRVGLGYWGPSLARNFDHRADLAWLCDFDEGLRDQFAARYPRARVTADYEAMLDDPELEAVVIATPVPTHYALAKQ